MPFDMQRCDFLLAYLGYIRFSTFLIQPARVHYAVEVNAFNIFSVLVFDIQDLCIRRSSFSFNVFLVVSDRS